MKRCSGRYQLVCQNNERETYLNSPKIYSSSEYEKFGFLHFNRKINKSTVRRLIKLTKEKNRMMYYPIIVDQSLGIVDGQHRFEVCKILGLPVYYMIMDINADWQDVYNMNTTGKKHNISELIMLIGKYSYGHDNDLTDLLVIYDDYKETNLLISTLAMLFFHFNHSSGGTIKAIRDGRYEIRYRDETYRLLSFLDNMRALDFEDWDKNKFIFSITRIISQFKVNYESFLSTLEKNAKFLKKQSCKKDYIDHLIAVHDRNLKGDKRLVPSL